MHYLVYIRYLWVQETPLLYDGASLNFRFYDLLPLPHLLVVFTSVSSSFICIYFHFLIFSCIGLSFSCIGLSFSCIVYLLVVLVYDIDVFAHNINVQHITSIYSA